MRPVTVLTVDDQRVFRRAARKLVAATAGFQQVGEADCGERGLELAGELQPDIVLVNVRLPGMDGIETARRLAEAHPHAVVVLVSVEEVAELPSAVKHLRKQDLSTLVLRELWQAHGSRAA
jgi:two-component system, NarL family, invasion response regulator UvrY